MHLLIISEPFGAPERRLPRHRRDPWLTNLPFLIFLRLPTPNTLFTPRAPSYKGPLLRNKEEEVHIRDAHPESSSSPPGLKTAPQRAMYYVEGLVATTGVRASRLIARALWPALAAAPLGAACVVKACEQDRH